MSERKQMVGTAIVALILAGVLAYPDIVEAMSWVSVVRGGLETCQASMTSVAQTLLEIGVRQVEFLLP